MSSPQTWQVVIQKQLGSEYFVNDYHVQATSPTDAKIKGLQIVEIEKDVHRNIVAFVNMRVRLAPSTGQGTIYPLSGAGDDPIGAYLSLFNVIRVDLAPEFGRVGRKYLRLPIPVAGVNNGNLTPEYRLSLQTGYTVPLLNLGFVCKPNGQVFLSGAVQTAVGMRQLRRGSKRRLQPII